jgi:AhpD family alkylhydroperoxidase
MSSQTSSETSSATPRIGPLAPADWSPDLKTFFTGFRAAVGGGEAPKEGQQSGTNLLGTLARAPELTKTFLAFNGHLLYGTSLSTRQRELLVLRVAYLRRCDYEWAQHSILATEAGLTAQELDRVVAGPEAPEWTPVERALLSSVDELLAGASVGDDTWSVLAAEFDEQQLMDLVFTVGTYDMVAFALRTFGVQPEPGLAPHLPNHPAQP